MLCRAREGAKEARERLEKEGQRTKERTEGERGTEEEGQGKVETIKGEKGTEQEERSRTKEKYETECEKH